MFNDADGPGEPEQLGRGSHLVHKLFHARLQAPHLELDGHQLVGAHDGLLGVPPALLQHAPRRLVRAEVAQVLPGRDKDGGVETGFSEPRPDGS